MTHDKKKRGYAFAHHLVRNLCPKFKVYRLSSFGSEARQVFTTHKPFPGKIPLTKKSPTKSSFK